MVIDFWENLKVALCLACGQIMAKISQQNKQNRIEIYHQLCVLMIEPNAAKFHSCLQKFMSYLHAAFPQLFEYFKRTYVGRCKQWATCYKVGSIVNTNTFVEAFHRLLKVVYFKGKQKFNSGQTLAYSFPHCSQDDL